MALELHRPVNPMSMALVPQMAEDESGEEQATRTLQQQQMQLQLRLHQHAIAPDMPGFRAMPAIRPSGPSAQPAPIRIAVENPHDIESALGLLDDVLQQYGGKMPIAELRRDYGEILKRICEISGNANWQDWLTNSTQGKVRYQFTPTEIKLRTDRGVGKMGYLPSSANSGAIAAGTMAPSAAPDLPGGELVVYDPEGGGVHQTSAPVRKNPFQQIGPLFPPVAPSPKISLALVPSRGPPQPPPRKFVPQMQIVVRPGEEPTSVEEVFQQLDDGIRKNGGQVLLNCIKSTLMPFLVMLSGFPDWVGFLRMRPDRYEIYDTPQGQAIKITGERPRVDRLRCFGPRDGNGKAAQGVILTDMDLCRLAAFRMLFWECILCNKGDKRGVFRTKSDHDAHYLAKHAPLEEGGRVKHELQCQYCRGVERIFPTIEGLIQHKITAHRYHPDCQQEVKAYSGNQMKLKVAAWVKKSELTIEEIVGSYVTLKELERALPMLKITANADEYATAQLAAREIMTTCEIVISAVCVVQVQVRLRYEDKKQGGVMRQCANYLGHRHLMPQGWGIRLDRARVMRKKYFHHGGNEVTREDLEEAKELADDLLPWGMNLLTMAAEVLGCTKEQMEKESEGLTAPKGRHVCMSSLVGRPNALKKRERIVNSLWQGGNPIRRMGGAMGGKARKEWDGIPLMDLIYMEDARQENPEEFDTPTETKPDDKKDKDKDKDKDNKDNKEKEKDNKDKEKENKDKEKDSKDNKDKKEKEKEKEKDKKDKKDKSRSRSRDKGRKRKRSRSRSKPRSRSRSRSRSRRRR